MSQVPGVDCTNDRLGQATTGARRCCYIQRAPQHWRTGGGILFPFITFLFSLHGLSTALCTLFTVCFMKARGLVLLLWNSSARLWLDLLRRKNIRLLRKALGLMGELGWTFFKQTNKREQLSVWHWLCRFVCCITPLSSPSLFFLCLCYSVSQPTAWIL